MNIQPIYHRRKTHCVRVGELLIGSDYPIRLQTMANTSTNDIEGSVAQALRCAEAGAELVRFTTQGLREVEALGKIRDNLQIPLVADVHFQADVADAQDQGEEQGRRPDPQDRRRTDEGGRLSCLVA